MASTALYRLPEGCFYIDTEAAAEYEANGGVETAVSQLVKATTGEALDAWINVLWLPHSTVITQGEGRGYVDHVRRAEKLGGVVETIVSAGLPSPEDASGAVASITYKLTIADHLPVKDHISFIRFVPVGGAQTEIVWTIKLTPKVEGAPVGGFLKAALAGGLAALAQAVDAAKTTPSHL